MSYRKTFNPNIWDQPRPVHPIPPFANQQQNFFQNQGNFSQQFQNQNFNQNFPSQNQNNNIRPLLSLPIGGSADHQAPPFRKFNNNNNRQRPGPAFTRNNYQGNIPKPWNKNNPQNDFNSRQKEPYENHNNNNRPMSRDIINDHHDEPFDVPKFKSLVEQLKAVQNSKKNDGLQSETSNSELDAICAKNASEAPKKMLSQLKTMDKDGVKDLINNPKQQYKKKVLNMQAREKLREQMRKKLQRLGNEGDSSDFQLEPDECIDYEKLPETLIAQIGRTMDINLEDMDMDLSESMNDEILEDKDIEVVKQNLGNDFLMGSEMLLMNGFSLLAETDNESEISRLEESIPRMPPLPNERIDKPPSPPPEPVKPPEDNKAAFSSVEKPWSPVRRARIDDEWDIESAKNPDPPSIKIEINPPKPVEPPVMSTPKPSFDASVMSTPKPSFDAPVMSTPKPSFDVEKPKESPVVVNKTPVIQEIDDEWDRVDTATKPSATSAQAADNQKSEPTAPPVESAQRANETYGDYRRRLAAERAKTVDDKAMDNRSNSTPNSSINNNNRPQNDFNKRSQVQSNQPTVGLWPDDDKPANRNNNNNNNNARSDNWMSNNRRGNDFRNNQNQNQNQSNRKSRFDMDRGRDRKNSFQQRNLSRDTNNSHDSGRQERERFDDIKDGHNYRFQNDMNSQEPDINRLNTILNPKPLQFKGSFNKRTQNPSTSNNFRNRTPNNSVERDFDESLLPSPNDARPCYYMLQKVMEIDAEITRTHDKIHGIDKVISNLQSERIGYQKSFTRLQHDRKVLFDNLMKRAMAAEGDTSESRQSNDKSQSRELPTPSPSHKSTVEKKLQNIVDQKKRKHEEQPEEPKKKRMTTSDVAETTSAAEKAAQLQRQKEDEERQIKQREKKRLKQLRREREEAEKHRLEEKNRKEAVMATTVTIKQEPRDKSVDKSKSSKHSSKSHKNHDKPKQHRKILFRSNELVQNDNFKAKQFDIKVQRVVLAQNLVDSYKSAGFLNVEIDEWNKWCKPVITEKPEKVKLPEVSEKAKSPELLEDPLAVPESNLDPLAIDESLINPPTPGSNLTNDDTMLVEVPTEQDYSEWSGNFVAHEKPLIHLCNIHGKYVLGSSENGKLYKYHLSDGKLAAVFSKHKEICNMFLYDDRGSVYTVSSDGYLHKIKFKNFSLIGSENFCEPLQVIEKSKAGIFVGAKSGRIYRLKPDLTEREAEPICDLGSLILCLRATKEGSRNILLVSSRSNAIQVRDANDGLLLRTLSNDLSGLSIYDMLIEGSTIYCGSNRHEIITLDFTTGAFIKSRPCGAGAICVRLYKNYLIAACYDGNIYIFNTKNDDAAVNICGPSNMLLAMDLWDNKIIASTKDNTVKIMNIPM